MCWRDLNVFFLEKITWKKEFRRREMLLFFTIKMEALMSRANQQLRQQKMHFVWESVYLARKY